MSVSDSVHATCVAIDGAGVLLRGASGSGKSDLALRLIHDDARVTLVADDLVRLARADDAVMAHAPEAIARRLEVRGLGIVTLPSAQCCTSARIALVVDACRAEAMERLPVAAALRTDLLGCSIARISCDLLSVSAVARIHLALRHFGVT
ncbi:MAG: hypothetical protein AAGJ70_09980 [Pseudomonadota bacterium]